MADEEIRRQLIASGWTTTDLHAVLAPQHSPPPSVAGHRSLRSLSILLLMVTIATSTAVAQFILSDRSAPYATLQEPLKEKYRNDYYDYSFSIPPGWRLATQYMEQWNQQVLGPDYTSERAEYVVVTRASTEKEYQFMNEHFAEELRGDYNFAPRETIFIMPYTTSLSRIGRLEEAAGSVTMPTTLPSGKKALVTTNSSGLVSLLIMCNSSTPVRSLGSDSPLNTLALRIRGEVSQTLDVLRMLASGLMCR